jgi:hypothetical protein
VLRRTLALLPKGRQIVQEGLRRLLIGRGDGHGLEHLVVALGRHSANLHAANGTRCGQGVNNVKVT